MKGQFNRKNKHIKLLIYKIEIHKNLKIKNPITN
jgi:hypothetical protein